MCLDFRCTVSNFLRQISQVNSLTFPPPSGLLSIVDGAAEGDKGDDDNVDDDNDVVANVGSVADSENLGAK